MARAIPRIGDKVTSKQIVPAYYSDYAGNPTCDFGPGMVGIVKTIDIGRNKTGCCVDFQAMPNMCGRTLWRCFLKFKDIVILERAEIIPVYSSTYSQFPTPNQLSIFPDGHVEYEGKTIAYTKCRVRHA